MGIARKAIRFIAFTFTFLTLINPLIVLKSSSSCTHHCYSDGPRVAVIMAGTMKRLLLKSTVEKMLHPMVDKDGAVVDYFISLTTARSKSYRDNSYMARISPEIPDRIKPATIADFIAAIIDASGATTRVVSIKKTVDIDSDAMLNIRRGNAKRAHPTEDPDLRFPMFDIRSNRIQQTVIGNQNLLRMHYMIQSLWESAVQQEKENKKKYDMVIFLRDDTYWLSDFSLKPFVERLHEIDVFVPSCDAREPPMSPLEINDHILISGRNISDLFGNYYSRLFELADGCTELAINIQGRIDRGCNSEMLLKYALDMEGAKVSKVPQSITPFQRSVNVIMPDGSTGICFHKFCQSKAFPMNINNISRCNV